MNAEDAVREYRERQAPDTALEGAISMQYADAAIAALESENASLKALNEWLGTMNSTLLDLRESVVLEEHARAEQAEAELKLSREQTEYANEAMWGMVAEHKNELALRLEAEAELAALKARRCETCAYGNHSPICPMFGRNFDPYGFCHRWEAKP